MPVTVPNSATVELEIAKVGSPYRLRNNAAIALNHSASFPKLTVIPNGAVLSHSDVVPVRVLIDGAPTTEMEVWLQITPPPVMKAVLDQFPRSAKVGVPNVIAARLLAPLDSLGTLPVAGADLYIEYPGGRSKAVTTDALGIASFEGIVFISGADRGELSAVAAGAVPARESVHLERGPTTSIRFDVRPPAEVRVGQAFIVAAVARDTSGALSDTCIDLRIASGAGNLREGDQDTARAPVVRISGKGTQQSIVYEGPTGLVRLIAQSGTGTDTATIAVSHGQPRRILIIHEPAPTVVADSLLEFAPVIQVMDVAGNPVPHTRLMLSLCQVGYSVPGCSFDSEMVGDDGPRGRKKRGYLRGATLRESDSLGTVRFDSLRLVGPDATYRLLFRQLGAPSVETLSETMRYDADWAYNRNFVVVSAIRSIAGSVSLPDEFFDVRFRLRLRPWLHAMMYSDLSIVRRTAADTDSVHTNTRRLADASMQLNVTPRTWRVLDGMTDTPERFLYLGAQVRLFNTVPYMGVQVGSVELARSLFNGSSLSIGYITPFEMMPVSVDGDVFRPSRNNIAIDGFLRSSGFDFLKFLNIRGTVIVPVDRGRRPVSRIALAVPVGGLITF